ncbi:sugar phosphate nucleotidyltransferase, partial [Poseidonibacter sp.]|uniref:sugar phosphate nucleotidyltransferase n=1 Tax=Poseidonibacter sp. TaxID=2321188 RepID=UPI003C772FA1
QIAYSFEGEILEDEIVSKALGSAGGMKKIQDFSKFFDDTFVVLCADALIDLDIQKVIALHKEKKALATIALKQVPINETNKYGIVQLDENDKILTFQEKPDIKDAISDLANTGIYVFEPEIFDYIPSGKEFDIGGDLLPFLAKQDLGIYGVNIPYEWVDIGNVNDFYDATFKILSKEIKGYKINAKEVKEGIFIGLNVKINLDKVKLVPPVYIGSSTQVEDGAIIIGPSMIGSNCEIQEKVILRRSIVDDYKKINTLAKINEKILFSDSIISLDGTVTNTKDSDMTWLIDDTRRKSNKTNLEISISSLLKERSLR